MDTLRRFDNTKKALSRGALGLTMMAGLSIATAAMAQGPAAMAPPIQTNATQGVGSVGDSVFGWQEVPQNQQVPLTSAAFDQGGYQLYDSVGETIVVPFTGQNLYAMKFARSGTGAMYFVNEGDAPVLYVPRHGYLSNATVSGARWYPFGKGFHPTQPVYLGIAPNWSGFVGMGWYPNMYSYGGYWGQTSFLQGGVFGPSVGLYFQIGGQPYYGWNSYRRYSQGHPDFSHTGYYRRGLYRSAARPSTAMHHFGGANHNYTAHRAFVGGTRRRGVTDHPVTGGHQGVVGHPARGGVRTFQGMNPSARTGPGRPQGSGGQMVGSRSHNSAGAGLMGGSGKQRTGHPSGATDKGDDKYQGGGDRH